MWCKVLSGKLSCTWTWFVSFISFWIVLIIFLVSVHNKPSTDTSSTVKKEASSHQSEPLKHLQQPISSHVSFPAPKSKSSLSPAISSPPSSLSLSPQLSQLQSDLKSKERLSIKPEHPAIKSELTLSDIISQSALSQGVSTLGSKLEPVSDSGEPVTVEQALRMNIPTIRGGLNGSIADILEASGYGTETAFSVDDDIK